MRPELGIVRVPRKDSFIERTRQPPQMLNRDGMQRDSLVSLPFVAGGFGSGECRSRVNVNVRPLEREQLPDVSTGHVRHHDQRAPLNQASRPAERRLELWRHRKRCRSPRSVRQ